MVVLSKSDGKFGPLGTLNRWIKKSIVLCLARKELSAIAIHHELVATLGPEVVSYSSMTRYLHEASFVSSNSPATMPLAEPQFDDCDQAILLALTE
jgi:hypothetical protein